VELGHKVQITTDQYHFIVTHKVMVKKIDIKMTIKLGKRLEEMFEKGYHLDEY